MQSCGQHWRPTERLAAQGAAIVQLQHTELWSALTSNWALGGSRFSNSSAAACIVVISTDIQLSAWWLKVQQWFSCDMQSCGQHWRPTERLAAQGAAIVQLQHTELWSALTSNWALGGSRCIGMDNWLITSLSCTVVLVSDIFHTCNHGAHSQQVWLTAMCIAGDQMWRCRSSRDRAPRMDLLLSLTTRSSVSPVDWSLCQRETNILEYCRLRL